MIKLFAPEKTCICLAGDAARLLAHPVGKDRLIELVGFLTAALKNVIEIGKLFSGRVGLCRQPEANCLRAARFDFEHIMGSELSAGVRRIHCVLTAVNDVFVERILNERINV